PPGAAPSGSPTHRGSTAPRPARECAAGPSCPGARSFAPRGGRRRRLERDHLLPAPQPPHAHSLERPRDRLELLASVNAQQPVAEEREPAVGRTRSTRQAEREEPPPNRSAQTDKARLRRGEFPVLRRRGHQVP